MSKTVFKVCAAFDTETTTFMDEFGAAHAFACLYIINDLRTVNFKDYKPGKSDDVRFMRSVDAVMDYVADLIDYGKKYEFCPVVAAYNLMFDLQTLQLALAERYDLAATAQNGTHVYVYDIVENGKTVLRFWDTFFLEMGGLAAMGRNAGLPKAVGDWDYTLTRSTATPLTEQERFYASRDTQVIPAYLKYLLSANPWMTEADFACTIFTKTSIVRRMAMNEIGPRRIRLKNGKQMPLLALFENECKWEEPSDFQTYCLRKACFRGGFTFTAAANASRVVPRVVSIDAVSMHHAFINGRRVPQHFQKAEQSTLQQVVEMILDRPRWMVLENYDYPCGVCINAMVEFTNIRLRAGSVFEREGIALLASSKFATTAVGIADEFESAANVDVEENVRAHGWHDSAEGAEFAFGKLYRADRATVCLTEIELWCISRVYEWDKVEAIAGELTFKSALPPDYATLQSNLLFERKQAMKQINKTYHEGEAYPLEIPDSIPEGFAKQLKDGSISNQAVEAYYIGTVKGMFNGCYGVQAMDVFRPDFKVDEVGNVVIDPTARVTEETFEDKRPDKDRALYTYGTRIVAGSRMHLVIVLELIHEAFGDRVRITGGDTDSVKMSLATDVEPDDVIAALAPVHEAVTNAIAKTQTRVRRLFPDIASDLAKIGTFELEPATRDKVSYDQHFEAWNKARLSVVDGNTHITCAGLSRPDGRYTIEDFADDLLASGYTFEQVAPVILGYNVQVAPEICHSLQRTAPATTDRVTAELVDYQGNSFTIDAPEAVALYPQWRELGATAQAANLQNVQYLERHGFRIETEPTKLDLDAKGNPRVVRRDCVIMKGKRYASKGI